MRRRLLELDRRLALLDGLRHGDREAYLADVALQAQVERHLQLALQAAIDVAPHLAADAPGRAVEGYGDAFVVLGETGVLPVALAGRLTCTAHPMKYCRTTPSMESCPPPPAITSRPAPPLIRSSPGPPLITSLPLCP